MRYKNYFLVTYYILYLFGAIQVQAQSFEIQLEDLTFHSEFEKECFYALENDSGVQNMFNLGLAYNNTITKDTAGFYYNAFLKPQENILFHKVKKEKPNTVNKFLYRVIHEIYLNKYEVSSSFFDLIDKGLFNCVSSSMLYALIFERYDIPYIVKKLPDHVYLLVFPESKKPIKVETTDPLNGYVLYTETFKENYIKDLTKAKVISQNEYDSKSIRYLFSKYFFNDEELTLKGLFSLQYLNNTLNNYSAKDYNSALINAEKAYYLNPDKKINSIINSTISLSLQGNFFEGAEDYELYSKAINYELPSLTKEQKLDIFKYITQRYLFDEPDEEQYHKIYSFLLVKIKSKEWLTEISAIYYTELCRKMLTYSTDKKETLNYGLKALELKPTTFENQRLAYLSFSEIIKSEEPQVAYQELTKILEAFPFLINNKMFTELKGNLLLNNIIWAFQNQKPDIGSNSLIELENFLSLFPDLGLNQSLITRAYSEVAIYYFRQGNKYKSINVLEKGLKYAPTSYELNNRLRQLTQ